LRVIDDISANEADVCSRLAAALPELAASCELEPATCSEAWVIWDAPSDRSWITCCRVRLILRTMTYIRLPMMPTASAVARPTSSMALLVVLWPSSRMAASAAFSALMSRVISMMPTAWPEKSRTGQAAICVSPETSTVFSCWPRVSRSAVARLWTSSGFVAATWTKRPSSSGYFFSSCKAPAMFSSFASM